MNTDKFKFGRRFAEDKRDIKFRLRRGTSKRTERYWRDTRWWGNQGQTPHCVGYAWAHWLINSPILNFVNPDGLYSLATMVDEWEDDGEQGTSVRAGAKILQRIGLIRAYNWCWDVNTLAATLLEEGPVVVGTNWYEGMMVPDKKGYLRVSGQVYGGHAYLLTGYSSKYKRFRMKNSWGRDWGRQGRAYITNSDMDKLIAQNGEVCLAIEQPAIP